MMIIEIGILLTRQSKSFFKMNHLFLWSDYDFFRVYQWLKALFALFT
jgi:hypothetical protein